MKISFQIIHNYEAEPLKIIGNAFHLTLQDDLYIQLDLRTTLDFLKINLNKTLNSTERLCYFEIEIDKSVYDLSKYDDFIDGFVSRLKNENGFVRLIKYTDEIRIKHYVTYYKEIAAIEMKIREVFSYIFYNKYKADEVNSLEEYEVKYPAEKPTTKEFEDRNENPFFYFTFTGYYQFDKPKEVPVKEIIPLIQSNEQYNNLRNYLNLRGILEERHIDFLKKIREKLNSIESVRNCISHSRAIPKRTVDNYVKALPEVLKFIDQFWEEEYRIIEDDDSMILNNTERFIFENIIDFLATADWDENKNEVTIYDLAWADNNETVFKSLKELKDFFHAYATKTAIDFGAEDPEQIFYELIFEEVQSVIQKYLIIMGWV